MASTSNSSSKSASKPTTKTTVTVPGMEEEDAGYRWETGYEKTWEAIEEDSDGLLDSAINDIIEKGRRKRVEERRAAGQVRLGIMRHLYIVIDMSQCMMDQDLKPTRIVATGNILSKFIDSFFDGNPMSQVGWIGTRNKKAERLVEMTGNVWKHLDFVKTLDDKTNCVGEPSLQNSLELALSTLKHLPNHTSKEIIIINGSLTTCDPGDIHATVQDLKNCGVRCSVISLGAEVRICKTIAKETGGTFGVILDEAHFQDLLHAHIEPPAMIGDTEASLIKMGFPQKTLSSEGGMCLCHLDDPSQSKFATGGYICPQCNSKYCELPVECKACGLTLVSAPHLARSFLHIFPLGPFEEIDPLHGQCFACLKTLPDTNKHIYMCRHCKKKYCLDCDLFLHEVLHSCPGCAALPPGSSQTNSKNA